MNDFRDLGDLGENTLRQWASQCGIAATKSLPDRNGWDFILEFPPEPTPADLALFCENQSILRCVLQVKSSDRCNGSLKVSLRAWKRLAEFQLPAFFLIIAFNGGEIPQRAFLVHIDESWISRVEEQTIKSKSSKRPAKNPSLTLQYSESDELRTLNGKGLKEAVRQHIGQSIDGYILHKISILEKIRAQQEVRITIPTDGTENARPEELFADLALGLRGTLRVDKIEFYRKGAKNPHHTVEGGELTIGDRPKVEMPIRLRFRDTVIPVKTGLSMGAAVNAHTQAFFSKFRISNEYIDIVLCPADPSKSTFQLIVPEPEVVRPLQMWVNLSSISEIMRESFSSNEELYLELIPNESEPSTVGLRSKTEPHSIFKDLHIASHAAWKIAKHLDLHEELSASLEQLLEQRQRLLMLADLLGPDSSDIKIGFPHPSNSPLGATRVRVPIGTEFILGDSRFIFAFSIYGSPHEIGKDGDRIGYEIRTFEKKLSRTCTVPRGEESPTLSQVINEIADSSTDDIPSLIMEWYSQ